MTSRVLKKERAVTLWQIGMHSHYVIRGRASCQKQEPVKESKGSPGCAPSAELWSEETRAVSSAASPRLHEGTCRTRLERVTSIRLFSFVADVCVINNTDYGRPLSSLHFAAAQTIPCKYSCRYQPIPDKNQRWTFGFTWTFAFTTLRCVIRPEPTVCHLVGAVHDGRVLGGGGGALFTRLVWFCW